MTDEYYCYLCGADSSDIPSMDEQQMEEFDFNFPEADRSAVYEGRCPFCGFSYNDEDDENGDFYEEDVYDHELITHPNWDEDEW